MERRFFEFSLKVMKVRTRLIPDSNPVVYLRLPINAACRKPKRDDHEPVLPDQRRGYSRSRPCIA